MTETGMRTINNRHYPTELTDVNQWLCFKLEDKGNGKYSKPPCSPLTSYKCDKTNQKNWETFDMAMAGVDMHTSLDGIGFIFANGFMAIDLDDCVEPDGTLNEMATSIYERFSPTYIERSPSGTGLHIFCQGEKPNNRTRVPGIEVYAGPKNNFVTVTGDWIKSTGTKVLYMQDEIDWLFETYLPDENIPTIAEAKMVHADHGDKTPSEWFDIGYEKDTKFRDRYDCTTRDGLDESSVDLSLLSNLAYWLNKDVDAIERFFLESPWFNSKDDYHKRKITDRDDYFERTLEKALACTVETAQEKDKLWKDRTKVTLRLAENKDGEVVVPLDDYNDAANARAFTGMFRDELAYCKEFNWCVWNGNHWDLSQKYQAQGAALDYADTILDVAKDYLNDMLERCEEEGIAPQSQAGKTFLAPAMSFMKHANMTNSARGIGAFMELSKNMLMKQASLFDGSAWELNTPGRVVDLQTGNDFSPQPDQYHSKTTTITYNPNPENYGLWDGFLDTIFCGDRELIDYMQLVMGSACVGKVYEEKLMITTGSGSNGKSTFFNIIRTILGDYCISVNPDILMGKQGSEQQYAIAQLKGRRLIVAQETESGQIMSTSFVKRITSTDQLTGRNIYDGPIRFTPTHTMMLATNHLPTVKDNDEGTWRRLTVIPFNAVIQADDMITNYQEQILDKDGEYVLKWLVDGAIRFYELNCIILDIPEAVRKITTSYRLNEMDNVEAYMAERLWFIPNPNVYSGYETKATKIYEDYMRWCEEKEIEKPLSKAQLFKLIRRNKYIKTYESGSNVKGRGTWWKDVVFRQEDGSPPLLVRTGGIKDA